MMTKLRHPPHPPVYEEPVEHDEPVSVPTIRVGPILPLLGRYGGALHGVEMRLREISLLLPDAMAQSYDFEIDAALKMLAEIVKE
jgi:hypothetical protein